MTGIERLRAGLGSSGAGVPFADLLQMTIGDIGLGHVTVSSPVPSWVVGGPGGSLTGAFAALADAAGGLSVLSMLPPERMAITAQLRLDFVEPLPGSVELLSCRANARHVDTDVGLAQGEISNADGSTVALMTLWARVVSSSTSQRLQPTNGSHVGAHKAPAKNHDGVPTSPAPPDRLRRLLTLPLLAALHVSWLEASDGRARFRLPQAPQLANSVGSMHGGAIALLADLSAALALSTQSGADYPEERRLWQQVDYLRPAPLTEATEFRAAVVTRTSRMASVEGEVVSADGTTVARIHQTSLM